MLDAVRKRKEDTYPELTGENGRTRLVVLAAEVGGRWSGETAEFLCVLAKARAQSVPLNRCVVGVLSWLAAQQGRRLLVCNPTPGTGDAVSSHKVLRDDRFA